MAHDGQDTESENSVEQLLQEVEKLPAEEEKKPDDQPAIDPTKDPDAAEEAELTKALADAEAKEAAAAKDEEPNAEAEAGKDQPTKAEGEQPEAKTEGKGGKGGNADGVMIPKSRFDEVLVENRRLRDAAAYHKGVADARAQGATKPEDKPNALTPDQQIADLKGQIKTLAKQVDSGDMNMSDFEDKRQELLDQIDGVREAARKPANQTQAPASDLYLDDKTAELETAHPYLAEISSSPTAKEDYQFLTVKAVASLAQKGIVIPKGTLSTRDQLVLRTEIAELSDTLGPVLTGKKLEIPGKKVTADPPANGGMSKEAQQRATKLEQARKAPADLTAVGRTGTQADQSEAAMMAMSDDELLALPESVINKAMGRLPG